MSDNTLEIIKRKNLHINKMSEMLYLTQKNNLSSYSELILGLPEETLISWKKGITDLLEVGQHDFIDVWFTQLLKNSELSSKSSLEKYKIKSTIVKDYLFLFNNFDPVIEYMEIVKETSTMTTEEITEGYMYGWIIIHFHILGYTQLLSKYSRKKGISYQTFYDKILEKILLNPIIEGHYNRIKYDINHYLKGESPSNTVSAHSYIHTQSHDFVYNHREELFKIGIETINELLSEYNPDISKLQKMFIYDEETYYPYTYTFNIDCDTFEDASSIEYQINSKYNINSSSYIDRRNNRIIKNIITKA
jgi:hypothetical protein